MYTVTIFIQKALSTIQIVTSSRQIILTTIQILLNKIHIVTLTIQIVNSALFYSLNVDKNLDNSYHVFLSCKLIN